jgi:hypothetical protein
MSIGLICVMAVVAVGIFTTSAALFAAHRPLPAELANLPLARGAQEECPGGIYEEGGRIRGGGYCWSLVALANLPLARIAREVYPEGSTTMFPTIQPKSLDAVRLVIKEQIDISIETHNSKVKLLAKKGFRGLQKSPDVRVEIFQGPGPLLRTQSDGLITLNIRLLQADIVGGLQAGDRYEKPGQQGKPNIPNSSEQELTRLLTHMQAMKIDLARHRNQQLDTSEAPHDQGLDDGWIALLFMNQLFINTLRFQLLHEIGHIVLNHYSDECDSKHCALFMKDELAADRYGAWVLIATWNPNECPHGFFADLLFDTSINHGFDAFFGEVYGLAGFHGEKDCGCDFPLNQTRLAALQQALHSAAAAHLNPTCTEIYK